MALPAGPGRKGYAQPLLPPFSRPWNAGWTIVKSVKGEEEIGMWESWDKGKTKQKCKGKQKIETNIKEDAEIKAASISRPTKAVLDIETKNASQSKTRQDKTQNKTTRG